MTNILSFFLPNSKSKLAFLLDYSVILEDVIICLGNKQSLMKTKLFPVELLTPHGWKDLDVLCHNKKDVVFSILLPTKKNLKRQVILIFKNSLSCEKVPQMAYALLIILL